jgi:hypothetical protein
MQMARNLFLHAKNAASLLVPKSKFPCQSQVQISRERKGTKTTGPWFLER